MIASLVLTLLPIINVWNWRMVSIKVFYAVETWSLNCFSNSYNCLNTVSRYWIFMPNWWKADFLFWVLIWQSANDLAQAWNRLVMNYSCQGFCRIHKVLDHCLMSHFQWHVIARIIIDIIYSLNWLNLHSCEIISIF